MFTEIQSRFESIDIGITRYGLVVATQNPGEKLMATPGFQATLGECWFWLHFRTSCRIDSGDERAAAVFDAMVYQIAKEADGMAAVLRGNVDAVLLTGGMARSKRIVSRLREYLEWIAPIKVYPGEDELQFLAEGVFRVLSGEEQPKTLARAQD